MSGALALDHTEQLWGKDLKKMETSIFALKYITVSVMSWDPLVRFILPDGLFDYFEMSDFKPGDSEVHIYLEELNIDPVEYQDDKLESKGFYEEIKMHDYPLRRISCIMHIKCRRWMNHTQEKVVTRNWELIAKGTQISGEFASFLKAMDRLSRH